MTKRISVAGVRRRRTGAIRRDLVGDLGDVAGESTADVAGDWVGGVMEYDAGEVASFRHALSHGKRHGKSHVKSHVKSHGETDSMGRSREARVLEDEFTDFMAGDLQLATEALPTPDPRFRETLRRRLWRAQVMARLGESIEIH